MSLPNRLIVIDENLGGPHDRGPHDRGPYDRGSHRRVERTHAGDATPPADNATPRPNSRMMQAAAGRATVQCRGHHYEFIRCLDAACRSRGQPMVIGVGESFTRHHALTAEVHRDFTVDRLWQHGGGVDGRSGAKSQTGWRNLPRVLRRLYRRGHGTADRNATAAKYAANLQTFIRRVRPVAGDRIVFLCADDFSISAAAEVLSNLHHDVSVDALFHFALVDSATPDTTRQLSLIGETLSKTRRVLGAGDGDGGGRTVRWWATTEPLVRQLRAGGQSARWLPYPIWPAAAATGDPAPTTESTATAGNVRSAAGHPVSSDASAGRGPRILLVGFPRREKGRAHVTRLISEFDAVFSAGGRLAMQANSTQWRSMVPRRHHSGVVSGDGPVTVVTTPLAGDAYHEWIGNCELAVFPYQPRRYQARCSAALLEMMALGKAVIVPDGTTLAEEVRAGGGHRAVGYIFEDVGEIPDLIRQYQSDRAGMLPKMAANAKAIRRKHHPNQMLDRWVGQVVNRRRMAA